MIVVDSSGYTQTTMDISNNSTTTVDALLLPLTSNCSTNTSRICSNTTLTTASDGYKLLLPVGVIIVIVLAAACLVLGIIYAYVYFTRVSTSATTKKPKASSRQQHGDHNGDSLDDSEINYTTHMLSLIHI